MELSRFDYQHAAELALHGKLPVPPRVDPQRCEARLVVFPEGVVDEWDSGLWTHGVEIVTRGAQGRFAETRAVYAANSNGNLVTVEERWLKLDV